MGKFRGVVGYGYSRETAPGVMEDVVVEYSYRGNVLRDSRGIDSDPSINMNLTVGNSISIVADEYASKHAFAIRYVLWRGVRWIVQNVEVKYPRLELRLGGVYRGQTPDPSSEAGGDTWS